MEDPDEKLKMAHAIIGSVAWVFFFPLGAILIRVLRTDRAVWIHAGIQAFATILVIVNGGLGIQLALNKDEIDMYHAVIGLVLFSVVFFQATAGLLHHFSFRKHGRRTLISYSHVWLGRALITLGMINGGLGLLLADDANTGDYIAYGIVAGVIWLGWIVVDVWATVRQPQKSFISDKHHVQSPTNRT